MNCTYRTSEVARIIGIHPNTVRMYEDLSFISKPIRKDNGYRVYTDLHIMQLKLVRIALRIEVLQNGLRKQIISVIRKTAEGKFDEALILTNEYLSMIKQEKTNANEAAAITTELLSKTNDFPDLSYTRSDVSNKLGISIDTLRNWEMNGLLAVKRKENGYRIYSSKDLQRLKIIRSLRCANYSLSAILRMINEMGNEGEINIHNILNTPKESEEIISVCDKLITSLEEARQNGEKIIILLNEMKNKF